MIAQPIKPAMNAGMLSDEKFAKATQKSSNDISTPRINTILEFARVDASRSLCPRYFPEPFSNAYRTHLQPLKLKGLQPKTIDTYARVIRPMGAWATTLILQLTSSRSHNWPTISQSALCEDQALDQPGALGAQDGGLCA
jgi:hypothetical protein